MDFVDAFKMAKRLVEVVQWLGGKSVKVCSEDLSALPPVGFGIVSVSTARAYCEALANVTTPAESPVQEALK